MDWTESGTWWNDKTIRNERKGEKKWIDNWIGDYGAKTISESLKINTSLTQLNLGCDEKKWERGREKWKWLQWIVDNQIGYEGAKTISESLRINTSLTELYLDVMRRLEVKEKNENF